MGNYINSDGLRYLYQKLKSIFVKNDDPRFTDIEMIKKKNQELEENINAIHKVYKGTSEPTTNLGKDGDVYFQIEA